MAISSSSISTFGSLQPRGNAMSGAINFIRGKASQSISGVKSKIGGLGSNIGEKIKNISTKPQSNVGERSNVVRDVLQTFGNEKTEKILTKNLKILRDTFVETFEVARLLRASVVGAGGLGAGSGGGGGGGLSPLVAGGIGAALAGFGKRIVSWTKNLVKGSVNNLKRILGIPVKPTATTTNLGPRLQSKNIKGTQGIQGTQGTQGIQGKPGKPGATTQISTSTSTTNNISNTRNNTTTTNQNRNIRNTQSNTSTASNNIRNTNRISNINNTQTNVNNIKPRGNILSKISPKVKNILKFGGGNKGKLLLGATLAAGGLFGLNALNKKGDGEGGSGLEGDALDKFDTSVDKFGEFVTKVTPSENEKSFSERENVPMIPNKVDPKKPQGFMRAVAGYADWLTLNTFDFDRRGTLLDGIKNIVNPKEVETKIPKTSKKKPNIVMLPGMGAAAVPPQQGQKIVNPNGGVGNSIDYPFLSSSKSDNFGALESKMIYNVVG